MCLVGRVGSGLVKIKNHLIPQSIHSVILILIFGISLQQNDVLKEDTTNKIIAMRQSGNKIVECWAIVT